MHGIICEAPAELVLIGIHDVIDQKILWVKILAGADKKEIYVALDAQSAGVEADKTRTYATAYQFMVRGDSLHPMSASIVSFSQADAKLFRQAEENDLDVEANLLQSTLKQIFDLNPHIRKKGKDNLLNVYAMKLTRADHEHRHKIEAIAAIGSLNLAKLARNELKKLTPPHTMALETFLKSDICKIEFKTDCSGDEKYLIKTYLKLMKKVPVERLFTNPEAVALRSKRPALSQKPDAEILQSLHRKRMEAFREEFSLYGWTFEYEIVLHVEPNTAHLDYETRTILLNVEEAALAERLCQDMIKQVTQSDAQNKKQGIHGLTKIVYSVSASCTSLSFLRNLESMIVYWDKRADQPKENTEEE